MARFTYTAEKPAGEIYKGIAEASDRFELYSVIRREGGRIISVSDERENAWSIAYWNAKFTTIKEYDKILMSRNLGAMLSAGLSLARALAVLERQTRNPRLSSAISQIASDVRRGETFHSAIAKFPRIFSSLFVAMTRSGEEGGTLPEALKVVSEQMERMYDLKKKIRGAMIYPCIILIAVAGIGILMMVEVVPTLAQTFAEMDAELPRSTQLIIGLSNFLVQYYALAVVLVAGGIGFLYVSLRSAVGARVADFVFLHTPIIGGVVGGGNSARTGRPLAS